MITVTLAAWTAVRSEGGRPGVEPRTAMDQLTQAPSTACTCGAASRRATTFAAEQADNEAAGAHPSLVRTLSENRAAVGRVVGLSSGVVIVYQTWTVGAPTYRHAAGPGTRSGADFRRPALCPRRVHRFIQGDLTPDESKHLAQYCPPRPRR